jgi:hypothetical protein
VCQEVVAALWLCVTDCSSACNVYGTCQTLRHLLSEENSENKTFVLIRKTTLNRNFRNNDFLILYVGKKE